MTDLTTKTQTHTQVGPQAYSLRFCTIIRNPKIDWHDRCDFDDNGICIRPSYLMDHKPIPRDKDLIEETKRARQDIERVLKTGTMEDVGIIIKSLSLHYNHQYKNPNEIKSIFTDFYEDLKDLPLSLIKRACADYRRDDKNKFMATPGQIIKLIKPKYEDLEILHHRICKILNIELKNNKFKKITSMIEMID